MGSFSEFWKFGNVELGLRLPGLRICKMIDTKKYLRLIFGYPLDNFKSGLDPLADHMYAQKMTTMAYTPEVIQPNKYTLV